MLLNLTFILCTLLHSCRAPLQNRNHSGSPLIRVGIIEGRKQSEFRVKHRIDFVNRDGTFALKRVAGGHWRVEVVNSKPARFVYRLSLGTTKTRRQAEDLADSARRKGIRTEIKTFRRQDRFHLPFVPKAVFQVLAEKRFKTEKDARAYQKKLSRKANSEIVPVPSGKPHGHLRFTNLDNHYSFDAPKPIQVIADEIELADVDVGSGFHWETTKHRIYGGRLEYLVDAEGLITVVNELSLEEYLKGVVPSEMPPAFPYEALKAQAVAARVEAISKIGLRHPYDPFDLCDDVHCQVYSGRSRQAEKTDMAVESTRGIFMLYKDRLAEAFYAGVCGGHTENNENVWLTDPQPYLRGILDKAGQKRLRNSLEDEKNVRKWIDSSPDVYCNARKGKAPKSVGYSKKYFRWQVEYSRAELEHIIHDKTGEDFGHLVDLVPKKRGVSGRVIELEVVGTKDHFVISRELTIRQALAPRTLFSSCFYVKKKGGTRGLPRKFVLKGAGWGHGVGMCQVGAAVMAARGKKFDQILTHYYRGIFLKKLYN